MSSSYTHWMTKGFSGRSLTLDFASIAIGGRVNEIFGGPYSKGDRLSCYSMYAYTATEVNL